MATAKLTEVMIRQLLPYAPSGGLVQINLGLVILTFGVVILIGAAERGVSFVESGKSASS